MCDSQICRLLFQVSAKKRSIGSSSFEPRISAQMSLAWQCEEHVLPVCAQIAPEQVLHWLNLVNGAHQGVETIPDLLAHAFQDGREPPGHTFRAVLHQWSNNAVPLRHSVTVYLCIEPCDMRYRAWRHDLTSIQSLHMLRGPGRPALPCRTGRSYPAPRPGAARLHTGTASHPHAPGVTGNGQLSAEAMHAMPSVG